MKNKVKITMGILIFFLVVFQFIPAPTLANFEPQGPPSSYNVPPPCTGNGCIINSNSTLTVQSGSGEDSDTEISSNQFKVGTDQDSSYVPNQDLIIVELDENCSPSIDRGIDECWVVEEFIHPHNKTVSFFNQRIYADGGISVAPGMNISLPGPNAVEIKNTLNGWYGFGFHARSEAPNTSVPENHPDFRNYNPAIWGQAESISLQDYPTTMLELFDSEQAWDPNSFNYQDLNFGIMGQGHGRRSIGVYGKAHSGGIAGFFSGGMVVDTSTALTQHIYAYALNPGDDLGLHMKVSALGSDITYHPIEVSSLQPDKVFFGGTMPNGDETPDVELCLNDTCISSWPSTVYSLQQVTDVGAETNKQITVGEFCIDGTCISRQDLIDLKNLIK